MVSRPIGVTAFVDWNSQMRVSCQKNTEPKDRARQSLRYVGRLLGRVLLQFDGTSRFDVTLRIYHGWHKGFEPTVNRRALVTEAAGFDFMSASNSPRVAIRPNVEYGDHLYIAHSMRLHHRRNCHLPNTLRDHLTVANQEQEKMVDTALASDIVSMAFCESDRWLIVLGEDDDLVPAIFVAEAALSNGSGKIFLVRSRPNTPFLKLDRLRLIA